MMMSRNSNAAERYLATIDVRGTQHDTCTLEITMQSETQDIIVQLDSKYGPGWLQYASGHYVLIVHPSWYGKTDKFIYKLADPGNHNAAQIAIVSHDGVEFDMYTMQLTIQPLVSDLCDALEQTYGPGTLQSRYCSHLFRDLVGRKALAAGLYTYHLPQQDRSRDAVADVSGLDSQKTDGRHECRTVGHAAWSRPKHNIHTQVGMRVALDKKDV